ncbi:hypothetical protein [Tengunoibacter tsumagoiensis]|uniref:Uncharacterized protein n=1 Tax=Tengunoibacter tsumagoiensis TaxID=2014871 RepID=A0A401ZTN4_9CHLR|nr:hypothetical protein [Tengunoibacter tsumagoiensis]GCE10278.1 hypothetical protein KTT_01370 [Tengunoibacter tsumagoiensis]
MISPASTQPSLPPEEQLPPSPPRLRPGERPLAQALKSVLRWPIKLLYYLITGIRTHKLLAFALLLLLLLSIGVTSYLATGSMPFGIGRDPYKFTGNTSGKIQNWLYALRDGDAAHLQMLDRDVAQPPDVNQLVTTYSQARTHLIWKDITVIGTRQQADTTVDSFVQVDMAASGPGGDTKGMVIWHFITATLNGQEMLLSVSLVDQR